MSTSPSGPADDAERNEAETAFPPRIPASAGALLRDRKGRLLILNPTYKKGWTIPGGIMEADGETPWEACRREVREECGLDVEQGRLVAVDFLRPKRGRPGGMRFLFDCGTVGRADAERIVLQADEIAEHRFLPAAEALPLLSKPVRRRVAAALRRPHVVTYLEDGRRPGR